jgi:hypothetical protein
MGLWTIYIQTKGSTDRDAFGWFVLFILVQLGPLCITVAYFLPPLLAVGFTGNASFLPLPACHA